MGISVDVMHFYLGSVLEEDLYRKIKELDFETLKNKENEFTEFLLEEYSDKFIEETADEKDFKRREEKRKTLINSAINNILNNITSNLNEFGKYAISKNTFFAESELDISTKQTWWSLWKNNIAIVERVKNKDLYEFESTEVIDLIKLLPTASRSRKEAAFTFVKQYMDWACYTRNYIAINPCEGINKESVLELSKTLIRESVISLEEFYEKLDRMSESTSWFNLAPLLLARYGIVGKNFEYMSRVKWTDIDYDKMLVKINLDEQLCDGENYFYINVDSEFLERIDKIKLSGGKPVAAGNRKSYEVDNGYVLKTTTMIELDEKMANSEMIYRRIMVGFRESKEKRISINALVKSRRIDLLLELRSQRRITTKDIQDVIIQLSPELTSVAYKPLKEEYEKLTGDQVLSARIKDIKELEDITAESFVNEFREKNGYY